MRQSGCGNNSLQEINMSKTFTLRSGILAMSLVAASGFAAAADNSPDNPPPGRHAQQPAVRSGGAHANIVWTDSQANSI
jgi:hypothetical protein